MECGGLAPLWTFWVGTTMRLACQRDVRGIPQQKERKKSKAVPGHRTPKVLSGPTHSRTAKFLFDINLNHHEMKAAAKMNQVKQGEPMKYWIVIAMLHRCRHRPVVTVAPNCWRLHRPPAIGSIP
jgi:hypothetical protein